MKLLRDIIKLLPKLKYLKLDLSDNNIGDNVENIRYLRECI